MFGLGYKNEIRKLLTLAGGNFYSFCIFDPKQSYTKKPESLLKT